MLRLETRELAWWYWLATGVLLTAGVVGWPLGVPLAATLTSLHTVHFALRHRSLRAFPVQVRLGYLAVLGVALAVPPFAWLPMIGTWARVLFGYCTMARLLSLLPWNRREPLSAELLRRTFLSRPVRGSIVDAMRERAP